ncbi:leucine-rich PPR motif-containing protein, mitochondrial-like [Diadema antillarum]|uniref:leucine-rich PPR motif-containing protein, mitochondrial-like n=1 Tax=Diadema antillarum TaxID=105358 RepID=UPI003A89B5B1
MAALMRSVKIARLLPAAARIARRSFVQAPASRCLSKETYAEVLRTNFNLRCAVTASSRFQSTSVQHADEPPSTSPQPVKSDNEFRIVLRRLDDMVRRTGRITKTQLLLVFDEVCKLGTVKPNQALLLIRSCGSLLPEVPLEERTALASNIWDKLKQLGSTYDVTHYNALLKVYLQNEHQFSPTDFLARMETCGIEPNRITYQRLISAYCLQGDIQGATKILEFMKSKDLPVTEGIFNSLITGHGRAGDLENAKNILNVMRSVGLEASSDTYTALMCAYAEKGDVESINELSQELDSSSQSLSGRCYLAVAYSLTTSGHGQHLSQILEKININAAYIPDAINLALSLMTKGEVDSAFEIVKLFENIRPDVASEPLNQGSFFIDHAVEMMLPHAELFRYLDEMKSSGLHSTPYIVALHSTLRRANKTGDYAIEIMKKMVEEGIPVRSHYFWPLLARHQASGDRDGILQTLKSMNELNVDPSSETYTRYILPVLGDSLEAIKSALAEVGVTVDKSLLTAICRSEVKYDRLDSVVTLIEEYKDLIDIPLIRASLISSFSRNPQVKPMVHICKHMVDRLEFVEDSTITKEDYLGNFLYEILLHVPENKAQSLKPHLQLLFDKLSKEGLVINGMRYRGMRNQLDRLKLPMLKRVAVKLINPDEINSNRIANFDILSSEDVTVEELENHLVELKEKGGNLRGILRRLILAHANNNNEERAIELRRQFDEAGYEPTGAMYACLINMYCNKENFSQALKIKEELSKFDPNFKLDVVKYRYLITSLAKENRLPDALDMVQEIKELAVETDRMEKQVFHMLNDLAQAGLSEEVERLFETVVEVGIVKPNNNLLGPVVMAFINRNDMTGALTCIRDCQAKYNIMPHFQDLLVKLVESGETDQLQAAMDFASQQHGDINMLYDLIFAFCTTAKYKEAMKLIETPGMIAKNRRLQWYAERCIGSSMVESLEQLTSMTRDLYACDRDQMYFYLIQLHTRNSDVDKCLQVWTTMQEEGVVPRDRTLRYLANVLRSFNRPVPFEVPQITPEQLKNEDLSFVDKVTHILKSGNLDGAITLLKEKMSGGEKVELATFDQVMLEILKLGNIEDALAVQKMAESSVSYKPSPNVMNKLMIEYIRRGDIQSAENAFDQLLESDLVRPSGLRLLCEKYQQDGDVDRLLSLKDKFETKTSMQFPFSKAVLGAYAVKNDISSALQYIEREIQVESGKTRRIGLRSFFRKVIQKNLSLDEVYNMVDRFSAQEVDGPAWQLLYAQLDSMNLEEAKAVVERYPVIKERSTGFIGYIIELMESDADVVKKVELVLDVTKDQKYLDRAKVYFYLLRAHVMKNDHEGGLMVKQRMEEEGLPVSEFMLKRLALLLRKNNQAIPFEEPQNSLSFYREKLRVEMKDNLPEIQVTEEES